MEMGASFLSERIRGIVRARAVNNINNSLVLIEFVSVNVKSCADGGKKFNNAKILPSTR